MAQLSHHVTSEAHGSRQEAWPTITATLDHGPLETLLVPIMARHAEAEREKRAKIIAAEGEALAAGELGRASDTMMAHPLALQLRNLQTMVEIGVDKNSTIVFPAPLMSTIQELGAFLERETKAARPEAPVPAGDAQANGAPMPT